MPRRLHTWKLRSRDLALGDRTLIVGVLNVTPDSFSDGGQFLDPDRAFTRAMQIEEQGADILDIGAESTRPGAETVSASEEMQRLVPVLKRLKDKLRIPISVDTYKAEVAERALELGAEIINDPSGFTFDPQLSKPVVQYNAGVIFNHMRGRPDSWATLGPMPDSMGSIVKDLDASVNRARRAGVERLRIVIDPGIGFGKRREQNSEILARLGEMTRLELPMMVGASRKSFLAQGSERETSFATAAAVTASILNGAHLVRVHDVTEMRAVASVADEILRAAGRLLEAKEAQSEAPPKRRAFGLPAFETKEAKPPVRPPLARVKPQPEENPMAANPDVPSVDVPPAQRPEYRPAAKPARPERGPERPAFKKRDFDRRPRPVRDGEARPPRSDRPFQRPERPEGERERPRPFGKPPGKPPGKTSGKPAGKTSGKPFGKSAGKGAGKAWPRGKEFPKGGGFGKRSQRGPLRPSGDGPKPPRRDGPPGRPFRPKRPRDE